MAPLQAILMKFHLSSTRVCSTTNLLTCINYSQFNLIIPLVRLLVYTCITPQRLAVATRLEITNRTFFLPPPVFSCRLADNFVCKLFVEKRSLSLLVSINHTMQ